MSSNYTSDLGSREAVKRDAAMCLAKADQFFQVVQLRVDVDHEASSAAAACVQRA